MNRREFIVAASGGFFAAAFAPLPALAAPTAKKNALTCFAVGTDGDFNWQAIWAPNLREAKLEWLEDRISDFESPEELEAGLDELSYAVPAAWQDLQSQPCAADWLHAGMGHVCDRCGYETSADWGGKAVAGEAICEDCLTLPDLCIADQEQAIETITDSICDEGVLSTKQHLVEKGYWAAVPIHIWSAAVREASKYRNAG